MNYKKIAAVFATGLFVIGLAGCSTDASGNGATPETSSSETAKLSQAEIDKAFLKIAENSCNRAWKFGVVEADGANPIQRIIIIPKEQSYKDFSGAWVDEKGKPAVLYEVELSVCWPSYLISMQEEANKPNAGDYEHKIEQIDESHYIWWEKFSEPEMVPTTYEVRDGYIVSSLSSTPTKRETKVSYGPVSAEDMNLLKQAVDAELASREEG